MRKRRSTKINGNIVKSRIRWQLTLAYFGAQYALTADVNKLSWLCVIYQSTTSWINQCCLHISFMTMKWENKYSPGSWYSLTCFSSFIQNIKQALSIPITLSIHSKYQDKRITESKNCKVNTGNHIFTITKYLQVCSSG